MSGRTHPAVIPPQERIKNFEPYAANLDERAALYEATRCIQCYEPPCRNACPTRIDIPEFIFRIKTGNYYGSAKVIRESNILGGECGYVCPVERLCEEKCVRNSLNEEPVAISLLQRFAYEKEKPKGLHRFESVKPKKSNKKGIAIIGSGPAGLSVAYELSRMGYTVTICDSNKKPGGLMSYGILPWKASWSVAESEIKNIFNYGIKFIPEKRINDVKSLLNEYDAVFIGAGTTKSTCLGIPGEELEGVFLAQDFLLGVSKCLKKEGKAPEMKGKRVAVVGGGDTAIDAAMAALRLDAEKVYLIYRRSLTEMPAVPYGRKAAREEGVEFILLTSPTKILGNGGSVKSIECIKMELGKPDSTGRRSVTPVKDSEFSLPIDSIIMAVGQKPDEEMLKGFGIKTEKGLICINKETFETSIKGVFAAGDVVNGGETVVEAVAEGKKAAMAIDNFLSRRNRS